MGRNAHGASLARGAVPAPRGSPKTSEPITGAGGPQWAHLAGQKHQCWLQRGQGCTQQREGEIKKNKKIKCDAEDPYFFHKNETPDSR